MSLTVDADGQRNHQAPNDPRVRSHPSRGAIAAPARLTSHFMAPPAEIRAARAFRTLDLCGESRAQLDGTLMLADSNPVVLYLRCLHDSAVSWLSAGPVAGVQAQRFLSIGASSSVS